MSLCRHHEIGNDAPVIRIVARAIRVENAHHTRVGAILPMELGRQRFAVALALVVARAWPNRVDVAEIGLWLRMHGGVAVRLARGGVDEARRLSVGELEQPQRPYGVRQTSFE